MGAGRPDRAEGTALRALAQSTGNHQEWSASQPGTGSRKREIKAALRRLTRCVPVMRSLSNTYSNTINHH